MAYLSYDKWLSGQPQAITGTDFSTDSDGNMTGSYRYGQDTYGYVTPAVYNAAAQYGQQVGATQDQLNQVLSGYGTFHRNAMGGWSAQDSADPMGLALSAFIHAGPSAGLSPDALTNLNTTAVQDPTYKAQNASAILYGNQQAAANHASNSDGGFGAALMLVVSIVAPEIAPYLNMAVGAINGNIGQVLSGAVGLTDFGSTLTGSLTSSGMDPALAKFVTGAAVGTAGGVLNGQDLSTAVEGGIKGAAIGTAGSAVGDSVNSSINADTQPVAQVVDTGSIPSVDTISSTLPSAAVDSNGNPIPAPLPGETNPLLANQPPVTPGDPSLSVDTSGNAVTTPPVSVALDTPTGTSTAPVTLPGTIASNATTTALNVATAPDAPAAPAAPATPSAPAAAPVVNSFANYVGGIGSTVFQDLSADPSRISGLSFSGLVSNRI